MGINKENQTKFKEDFFMTMKKTFAGILASIVAISAMATVAVSAQTASEKTFETYTNATTIETTATFTGLVTNHAASCTVTLPDVITANATEVYEVTSLTLKATTYNADAAKAYAQVSAAGVITISPLLLADHDVISVTVKVTKATYVDAASVTACDKLTSAAVGYNTTNVDANSILSTSAKAVTEKAYKVISTSVAPAAPVLTDVDNQFNGLTATIANQIADNKGVKLVVMFKDMEAASTSTTAPNYVQTATFGSASVEDFGLMLNNSSKLSKAAAIDKTAMTVTFDWDTLLASSNIANATGEVYSMDYLAKNELAKTYKDSNNVDQYKYQITGFKVIVPAAAPAVTTPAPATTTPAPATVPNAANSKTGAAAPIALAMIPAAIAVAYVAKKKA